MLIYILLLLVICVCMLLFVKLKKNKEAFRSRITMDDVLDQYCLKEGNGNNYEGPWGNSGYTGPARCGRYRCPKESCSVLEPELGRFNNPNAFSYVTKYENQVWSSNDEGSFECRTKHNPESNIYCEPNQPPQCDKLLFDQRAYRFNSDLNQWEERYVNYVMNSNNQCEFRDVNQPFDIVKLHNERNVLQHGDASTSITYYTTIPTDCSLTFDRFENYYYDSQGNTIRMGDEFERFNSRTNEFVCKNGSRRTYGFSNTPGTSPGFSCGWLDNNDCSGCDNKRKPSCYVFDSNIRSYSKRNFLQTFYNHDMNDATVEICDTYLVNPSKNDMFDRLNSGRPTFTDDMLDDDTKNDLLYTDSAPTGTFVITESNFVTTNNCRYDVVPDQCDNQTTNIYQLGMNMNSNVLEYYKTEERMSGYVPDTDYYPITNKLINLSYKRRWDATGSNCEYCVVNESGLIIDGSCESNLPISQSECPTGTQLNTLGFDRYCSFCAADEYFDSSINRCKPLNGCDEGYYFNPFSNIDNSFQLKRNENGSVIIDSDNSINKDNYEAYKYTFLNNNTSNQCTLCGPNTYMNQFQHVNLECNTCERMNPEGYLQVVDNNRCEECVISNRDIVDNYNNRPKYIKYDNGDRTCESCPELTNPQYSGQKVIAHSTDTDNDDGKCYRQCLNNTRGFNNARIDDTTNKEYDTTTNSYPLCEITCPANYVKMNNICEACPAGQESMDSITCTPCDSGMYNPTAGNSCVSCPNRVQDIPTNEKSSSLGSSNINQCMSKCTSPHTGCNVPFIGSVYSGFYNFDTCPLEKCPSGLYDREPLSSGRGGYSIREVQGDINNTIGGFCEVSPSSYDRGQNEDCESGETQIETFVVEPFGTTYCCPNEMTYSTTTNQCECKPVNFFTRQLLMNQTTHISTTSPYTYNSINNRCQPHCNGNAQLNADNYCELICNRNEYASNSVCTSCPLAPNAAAMTTPPNMNRDATIDDCMIMSCSNNYTLSDGVCVENTSSCSYYEPVINPSTINFTGNYRAIDEDANTFSISSGISQPSYHRKISDTLTASECTTKQASSSLNNCYNEGTDLTHKSIKQIDPSNVMCCGNETDDLSNGSFLSEGTKKYSVCCPNNQVARTTEQSSKKYIGCCPSDSNLYANSSGNSKCCPISNSDKTYYLNNSNVCDFSCSDGEKIGDACVPYNGSCPPKVFMKDVGYGTDQRGRVRYYESNIPQTTDVSCPTGDIEQRDLILKQNQSQCEFVYDSYYCCEDSNARYNGTTCVKSCSSYNIYETQEQRNSRLGSVSYSETMPLSVTINNIIGTLGDATPTTSEFPNDNEYEPNRIIYYKTTIDDGYSEYDATTSSYRSCPSTSSTPTRSSICPATGYTESENINKDIVCTQDCATGYILDTTLYGTPTCKRMITIDCHKELDVGDEHGIHYQMSNMVFAFDVNDCPAGWSNGEYPAPPGYESTKKYNYNNNYYAYCLMNSEGSNIWFNSTSNRCELTTCGVNQIPSSTTVGSCLCEPIYTFNSTDSNRVNKYTLNYFTDEFVPNLPNAPTCSTQTNNIPNVNLLCVNVNNNSNYCCPDTDTSKPYFDTTSNAYTCSNVWTSNIKPAGFLGYAEDAVVWHNVDYTLV